MLRKPDIPEVRKEFLMGKEIRGVALLLLTTMLWGCSFVAQRRSVDTVDAFTFNTGRMVSAFIALLVVVLVREAVKKRRHSMTGDVPDMQSQDEEDKPDGKAGGRILVLGGILCGLALFGGIACMQLGIMTTSAGKTGFITALYIIEVPVFYVIAGRRQRKILWLCVAMAVVGLWLLAVKPGTSFALQKGEVILLIGSVFFAFQIMLIDHFVEKTDPLLLTLVQFAVGAVLFPVCMLIFEDPSWEAFRSALIPILYSGVLSSAVGFTLQTVAQKDVEPTVASLIMSLEGVFAVIGAWVLIHEHMAGRELLGCALMLAAIVITQLPERKKSLE